MNKKDCIIVQDLLPNYIEKLTSQETNNFIEEHLSGCDDCKNILNNMKTSSNSNENQNDKKTINFIKKYNKKLNILKLIILIIVFVFIFNIARNAVILTMLSNKANALKDSKDYDIGIYVYSSGIVASANTTVLGDKYLRNIGFKNNMTNMYEEIIEASNGTNSNYYIEKGNDEKIAILNYEKDGVLELKFKDWCFQNDNFIRNVFKTNIKETICNRKKCYYISNILFPGIGICDLYIEKDTGIIKKVHVRNNEDTELGSIIGTIYDETVIDVYYMLDNLKDTYVKEPDVSNYKIMTFEEYMPIN